jgi:hypothetical protein
MSLEFELKEEDKVTNVVFRGEIDIDVDQTITQIASLCKTKRIRFDCRGFSRINSVGIMVWLKALEAFKDKTYSFHNCSEQFVDVAVMIPLFPGTGWIESLIVRYQCSGCGHVEMKTINIKSGQLPNVDEEGTCPKCTESMETDFDLTGNLETLHERGSFSARA